MGRMTVIHISHMSHTFAQSHTITQNFTKHHFWHMLASCVYVHGRLTLPWTSPCVILAGGKLHGVLQARRADMMREDFSPLLLGDKRDPAGG